MIADHEFTALVREIHATEGLSWVDARKKAKAIWAELPHDADTLAPLPVDWRFRAWALWWVLVVSVSANVLFVAIWLIAISG